MHFNLINNKKIRTFLLCISGAFLVTPSTVVAGTDSGFYIGAGAGDASIKEGAFDASDTAYKILAGYNIGFIPLVDFAVEGSYVDFGSPSSNGGNVDVTAFDAFGLVGLSFGPFGVFAKAGAVSWDLKTNSNFSDSGTDPAYGIGARFSLLSFQVRAEYEVFEFDSADADMLSVSAMFTF